MHPIQRGASMVLAAAAVLASARAPHAAIDAAEQARRDRVVLKVGPRSYTVGQLENKLAVIPRYQLFESFGKTPDAIRHKFLEDVVEPDLLLTDGAEDAKLDQSYDVARKLERAHAEATERALQAQLGNSSQITQADVQTYYDANKSQFESPQRINLWRILCSTADEAKAVLLDAQKDGTPKHFGELARDHSQDKATNLRGGNLGFIAADGTSNEAGLKVDPALYNAAGTVADGSFVQTPVPEQGMFAVVWRRGTVKETHRSVDEAATQIRESVWKERFRDAVKKLEADLRAAHLKEENASLVDTIEIDTDTDAILGKRRPGQAAPFSQVTQIGKPVVPPVTPATASSSSAAPIQTPMQTPPLMPQPLTPPAPTAHH